MADRMGADRLVNVDETDPLEAFGEMSNGRGSDVVSEAGGFEDTYETAL